MAGRIHASRGRRLTQISWYRRSDTKGTRKESREFPAGTTVTIGRGRDQAIILDDDGVSRNHARLEITDGKVLFEDLGSTNGSLLNGTQRIKRIDWLPGQRIRVGNFMLEVAFEASDATIIEPLRRPSGYVAGVNRSGPERPVLPRRIAPAEARLDPRHANHAEQPADWNRNGEPSVIDEGRDAARPVHAEVVPSGAAIPQQASQHPLGLAPSVGEIPSPSTDEEAEESSTGISAVQAYATPPLEISGNAASNVAANSSGSPPPHDSEATPVVSIPQVQDAPWSDIAANVGIDTTEDGQPRASSPQFHGNLAENQPRPNDAFAYDAFISYRHVERDREWAEWLIDALERYRLPKALQEKGYPPRLGKIFRDADEAPAASDLNEQIKGALRTSRFLIVVCSAFTPRSKWVQREIQYFNELGREDKILALLTEGEPEDSFPSLMLVRQGHAVEQDGIAKIVKEVKQPLAADVRPTRHQSIEMVKHLALLRLVASILGVKFDDLRQREYERGRHEQRTLAALTAALLLVIIASSFTYWEMMHPKVAYYRQLVWRWGLPEGLGLINNEIRGRRFLTYKVTTRRPGITQGPRVEEVRLENSAGQLSSDEPLRMEQGAHARWVVRYRQNGSPDKIEIFNRTGHLVREEILRKGPSEGKIIVDFERHYLPLTQAATQSLMLDPLDTKQQGLETKSEISRHELNFDDNGFAVERHYLTHWGERQSDAQGSLGQRFTYSYEGLILSRMEIGADNKQIALRNGESAGLFTYDGNLDPIRYKLTGLDDQPIIGPNGFAYYRREYDSWGNDTVIAYYGTDGKPVLHKDGYAKVAKRYDDRGNLIEVVNFGLDGKPTLDKDGVAKGTMGYNERGNVIEMAVFGLDGEPVLDHKLGVAKLAMRYDAQGRVTELAVFGVDGKPILSKIGVAKITVRYDESDNAVEVANFGVDGKPTEIAKLIMQYDAQGRMVELAALGADGKPTLHKDGYAKLENRYDKRGNLIEVVTFDVEGRATLHKDDAALARRRYDEHGNVVELAFVGLDGKPKVNKQGIGKITMVYDQRGNVIEETYFDVNSRPTLHKDGYAKLTKQYDERGNLIEECYLGLNGKPTLHKDGYAKSTKRYDDRGKAIETSTFGIDGKLTLDKNGVAKVGTRYDERGNVTEETYFGLDDKPVLNTNDIAQIKLQHDARGNLSEVSYFGLEGEPTYHKNGNAGFRQKFDERGNVVEWTAFGVDGRPVLFKDGHAKFRKTFDDRGNLIEWAWFGVDDKPTLDTNGVARFTKEYDARGNAVEWDFFGTDGKPTLGKNGFAKFTQRHDERGNVIEVTYFGLDGKLTLHKDGYAKFTQRHDERGNVIEVTYFGLDGKLTLHKDGYAKFTKQYDARGDAIEWDYFGVDGKPTLGKNGFAKFTQRHDERGNVIEEAYVGLEGEPALHKDGMAKVARRYDERGNQIEWAAFGVDGKRALYKDGYAILRRKFDERGKLIEVAYFDVDEKPAAFKVGYARITHSYDERGRSLGSKYFDKDDHEIKFDVVVTKIVPGTTAERIGLAPQDRIMSYNDVKPTSVQQFVDLTISTVGPTSRRLVIRRDQSVLTFEVPAGRLGIQARLVLVRSVQSPSEHLEHQ